ncbi:MAG: hypothetical protein EOO59_21565 [Hymenobacter sp.]|nr:MAG: hypothetical protein EOO59_21565 [Hymenobacter sp.]
MGKAPGRAGSSSTGPSIGPLFAGVLLPLGSFGVDAATGAARRFAQTEVRPLMPRLPKTVTSSQTIVAGPVNVRVKGGDKMGNFFVLKEAKEILYFGKSLDVNSESMQNTVNSTLKDLGYSVPTGSQSVFSSGPSARYSLQAEMRTIKYDINANHQYEALARFETTCTVEVTWKLVNQTRQTAVEQKTSGTSVRFEKGGSAAFEDAFENSLYAFLERADVSAALAGGTPAVAAAAPKGTAATAATSPAPAGSPASSPDKFTPLNLHRAAALKTSGDNGIAAAARCVATIVTSDGHGSGPQQQCHYRRWFSARLPGAG